MRPCQLAVLCLCALVGIPTKIWADSDVAWVQWMVECNLIPSPVLGMRQCGVVLHAGADTYMASKSMEKTNYSMAETGMAVTSRCREEVDMVLWLVSLLATFLWRAHRRCWRNGDLFSVPLTWPWSSLWTCSQRCSQPPSHHSTTTEASSEPLHVLYHDK